MKKLVFSICLKAVFLAVTLLPLVTTIAIAQYDPISLKQVEEIKKRILIVGLEEEDKSILLNLEDSKDKLSKYKATVEGKNKALKLAADSFWVSSKTVIFLPRGEARKLFKKEKDKYAFLHYGEEIANGMISYGYNGSESDSYIYFYGSAGLAYDYNKRNIFYNYNVFSLEIELPSFNPIIVYLPKSCPSKADVQLGILQMQYTFKYLTENTGSSVKEMMLKQLPINTLELKNKVLLLDAGNFRVKATQEEIAKVYPYPFKLVNYRDIENAVSAKDTNAVIMNFGRYNDRERLFYVLNAGNGKVYSSFINQAYDYVVEGGTFNSLYYPGVKLDDIAKITR